MLDSKMAAMLTIIFFNAASFPMFQVQKLTNWRCPSHLTRFYPVFQYWNSTIFTYLLFPMWSNDLIVVVYVYQRLVYCNRSLFCVHLNVICSVVWCFTENISWRHASLYNAKSKVQIIYFRYFCQHYFQFDFVVHIQFTYVNVMKYAFHFLQTNICRNITWVSAQFRCATLELQFGRQTVKSVLLWWFLHQFMLRKSRCHTKRDPRVQNRGPLGGVLA